ncbi:MULTISPECIES: GAF domain-containing protein [Streptomyces]|uniref:GAF domain-containing protein n=1 Tax=Streptomyces vinaceusdrappus TaxID=67376 RepID=A0ABY6BVB7_9ACTN|nr:MULTISPECIES: GAF domain-containing protein [Streptomyces]GGY61635.1 transcriptional regulator [Streptomyces geysiriensis]MBQ0910105.1 GAF domain-containing protein [Streptomyces sp. RM99]NUV93031.1 GAF domain-containing protein [Streptomyces sp. KAI 90]QCR46292.1 transcriptional regulator [Streptomyces sp. SGAir0924]RSR99691.1 GAF domain-containing protein [Streptomyces sp. WAC04189]
MTDSWLALEPGADPVERARTLRRAHEAFTEAGTVPQPVRPVVAESWRRSVRAGVGPDGTASVELMDDDLGAYRAEHPLAPVMPLIRELLGTFAADGEHLLAVCDAHGRLLWVEGHPATRRRADRMNFVPGARWSESAVGTNAPGTAVAVGRPVQVFTAEHFIRRVQPWTCAAAPVHDPRTGRVLGAVDITGGDGLAHPHSLGFVRAVARAAESQLALLAPEPPAAEVAELTALGRDEALLAVEGRRVRLSRRHSEIVVLLAHHPEGLTGDELLCALYEDEAVPPVTLRAELARLRAVLGPARLVSRPYRLTMPVESDATVVERRLRAGAVTAAASAYAGPLLPGSRAPAVERLRRRLADGLRAALIACADPDLLADWAHAPWGEDDLDVWRALAAVRPTAATRSRLAALESELAAPGAW